MNVLVRGQDRNWIRKLVKLCEKDQIWFYEEMYPGIVIEFIVTDFPIEEARKGICKNIPFLVVSREKREEKILEAFAKGAEDYMIAPVSPQIARARICRILSRYALEQKQSLMADDTVRFTPNEYRILSCMMADPGRVFSRGELMEQALTEEYQGIDRNIDNYIRQLRKKLEDMQESMGQIETVYGVGYRYAARENRR